MEAMAATQLSSNFWTRQVLNYRDRDTCLNAVQNAYINYAVEELHDQGYCSYTLLATSSTGGYVDYDSELQYDQEEFSKGQCHIIQLRPAHHAFDLDIVRAARITYPLMAPEVRALDLILPGRLQAYEMERLPGTAFSRLQPCHPTLEADTCRKLERLITSFADLIAQSWPTRSKATAVSRVVRADSPLEESPSMLLQCTGKVGSTITDRLQKLATELPVAQLRCRAKSTLMAIRNMTDYPVVLNHGDLIPSNILVNEDTWEITGIVDWAEAEVLPFGMCLYGLEHLLGSLHYPQLPSSQAASIDDEGPVFVYYEKAALMRDLFWARLLDKVPELQGRGEDVETLRDAGVLLWRGIAWDNGAIDRVVNELDDVEELACLHAFLGTSLV